MSGFFFAWCASVRQHGNALITCPLIRDSRYEPSQSKIRNLTLNRQDYRLPRRSSIKARTAAIVFSISAILRMMAVEGSPEAGGPPHRSTRAAPPLGGRTKIRGRPKGGGDFVGPHRRAPH